MEKQIEAYLYKNIPLTQAMGIKVEHASPQKVVLCAPFANNINHKKTVFGGSLHAVATLACWSLLYVNLKESGDESWQIVITKSDVAYHAPVDADFKAECLMPEDVAWKRFMKTLLLKEKARIQLNANIKHKERICVDYQGLFAAIKA